MTRTTFAPQLDLLAPLLAARIEALDELAHELLEPRLPFREGKYAHRDPGSLRAIVASLEADPRAEERLLGRDRLGLLAFVIDTLGKQSVTQLGEPGQKLRGAWPRRGGSW